MQRHKCFCHSKKWVSKQTKKHEHTFAFQWIRIIHFYWSDTAYRHVNHMNSLWRLECQWVILLDCLVQDFMAWSALSHPEWASSIDERPSSHVFDENSTSHAQKSSLAPAIRCSCFSTAICLIRDPWSRLLYTCFTPALRLLYACFAPAALHGHSAQRSALSAREPASERE